MERDRNLGSSQGTPNPTVDFEDSGYDDPEPSSARGDVVVLHRNRVSGVNSPKRRSGAPSPVVSDAGSGSHSLVKETVEIAIQTETDQNDSLQADGQQPPCPNLADELASAREAESRLDDESFVTASETPLKDPSELDESAAESPKMKEEEEREENVETSVSMRERKVKGNSGTDQGLRSRTESKAIEIEAKRTEEEDFVYQRLSLQPEMLRETQMSPQGNSLLNKGWSTADLSNFTDTSRSSSFFTDEQSSETESTLGGNFSSVIRSALICRQAAEESEITESTEGQKTAKVVESVDHGDFAAAMNEEVEIGRSTLADEEEDENGRLSREVAAKRSTSPADDYVMLDNNVGSSSGEKGESPSQIRFGLLGRVAPETGLAYQGYMCHTCRRYIGLAYGPFRVCAFDGCYYCADCHRSDEAMVPGKLVLSWDLTPKKVSRASKAFLEHIADRPLVHLDQINPTLYEAVQPMQDTLRLREQLSYVAMYLMTCKESVAEDLRKRLWPKEYLYNDVHLYSINDFINVSTGVLPKHLKAVISYARTHVSECRLCAQKGFICEICSHPQIIYPFQIETTHRCEKCYTVFHSECMKGRPCPKCQRREAYMKERKTSQISEEELMNHIAIEDT